MNEKMNPYEWLAVGRGKRTEDWVNLLGLPGQLLPSRLFLSLETWTHQTSGRQERLMKEYPFGFKKFSKFGSSYFFGSMQGLPLGTQGSSTPCMHVLRPSLSVLHALPYLLSSDYGSCMRLVGFELTHANE